MLTNELHEFFAAYNQLAADISDVDQQKEFITNCASDEARRLLYELFKLKAFHFHAFELLLHINPDFALEVFESWYLSPVLSSPQFAKNQESALDSMLDMIREILGEEKLNEVLADPGILAVNKKRIDYAMYIVLSDEEESN